MAELLSVTASSIAVVGLADLVIRAGKQVYQFLGAINDAPVEVESLGSSICDTILLVEDSKRYLEEVKQYTLSPSSASTTSLIKALPQFKSALATLEREMSALVVLIKRYKGTHRAWASVKFVFDERKIQRSLQKLETSKSSLVAALLLVGR